MNESYLQILGALVLRAGPVSAAPSEPFSSFAGPLEQAGLPVVGDEHTERNRLDQ